VAFVALTNLADPDACCVCFETNKIWLVDDWLKKSAMRFSLCVNWKQRHISHTCIYLFKKVINP